MEMPPGGVHGKSVTARLGSTGASTAPSSRRASRQQRTTVRRGRDVTVATILKGSSGCSEAAGISIFIARLVQRVDAVGRTAPPPPLHRHVGQGSIAANQ